MLLKYFYFILLLCPVSSFALDDIESDISSLLKERGWDYSGEYVDGDIDKDGFKEIVTLAHKDIKGLTYTNVFILKNSGKKVSVYRQNSRMIPAFTMEQYADGYLNIKDNQVVVSWVRGTGSRTITESTFSFIENELILEKQKGISISGGFGTKQEYFLLKGIYKKTSEDGYGAEDSCRPCLKEECEKNPSVICEGDNGYTPSRSIETAIKKQSISFDKYCLNFGAEKVWKKCSMNSSPLITVKSYLYKKPNTKTRMYLIKGDKVTLLDEQTDDSDQKWYFINYKVKKDLNMWIKAEAVDFPDSSQ